MIKFNQGIFILTVLVFLICKKENGCYIEKGKQEIRTLDLPPFTTINQNIRANFNLSSGPNQLVTIEGSKSILNLIEKESYVENSVWHLGFTSCVHDYEPIEINLTLPNYVAITNNGIGDFTSTSEITTENTFSIFVGGNGDVNLSLLDLDNVMVEITGNGNVKLSGNTINKSLSIKGNGIIDAFDLNSNYANVFISGTGNCLVRASDSLSVKINGNGSVYYKGYPTISQTITGNGSVIDAN